MSKVKYSKTPREQLNQIYKKYSHPDLFIRLYDNVGNEYNYGYDKRIRKKIAIGLESTETYNLSDLMKRGNVYVKVFTIKSLSAKRRSGAYRVKDREIYSKRLTKSKSELNLESISMKNIGNVIELQSFLKKNGYEMDRYGNFKKEGIRFKLSVNSFRIEKSYRLGDGKLRWTHTGGGYYKDFIIKNGKLKRKQKKGKK